MPTRSFRLGEFQGGPEKSDTRDEVGPETTCGEGVCGRLLTLAGFGRGIGFDADALRRACTTGGV